MRVGFTASAFDLFHAGHVMMLREAKSQCDWLIAALQVDPSRDRDHKNAPVLSLTERYIQLDACKYVDEIVVYETEEDLLSILTSYPIDVRIIGEEYRDTNFTGSTLDLHDVYYNRRDHNWSTSSLRQRVVECEKKKAK